LLSEKKKKNGIQQQCKGRGTTTSKKKEFTSVRDADVFSDRNAKYRRFMEDTHTIVDNFNDEKTSGFFAVYDGHGGKTAATFCQENFHKILADELSQLKPEEKDQDDVIKDVFLRTYARTDAAMKDTVPSAGACAATCLIRTKSDGKRMLYCANAGDSRAVLCRDGKSISLTIDHKATNPSEIERVVQAGGFVRNDRINGLIAISRALGDHCMKMFVISEPNWTVNELEHSDSILILACDGVWDVLSEQQAVDMIVGEKDCLTMAKKLLVSAIKGGSTDNITVLTVLL